MQKLLKEIVKREKREKQKTTKHLIPGKRNYLLDNKMQDEYEDIYDSTFNAENILFVGEPGCGKSEFILWFANKLNIPVVQIQGDGDTSVIDLIGGFQYSEKKSGTYWADGIIPFAIKNKCWILFDEINMILPEVLARIHSLLDTRKHLDLKETNKIVKSTRDTVIFGTMNPTEDDRHVGVKPLSPALLSRFSLIINFNFLSPKIEKELIISTSGINIIQADQIITFVSEARKAFYQNEIIEFIDTRMVLAWAKKAKKFGVKRSINNTILSRLSISSRKTLTAVLLILGIE